MYDLMALAFEGDITRSITFMLGRDLSGASFPNRATPAAGTARRTTATSRRTSPTTPR
jgi:hypothetical protein